MQMLLAVWTCLFRCTCVAILLQAHLYGCARVDARLDMPMQLHLCRHTSGDASVQTCLCRCICVNPQLWVQSCGHASAGELCGHACSSAFKMPLQMNLCRHASMGNLCGCAYGGTCLDVSWQMPLLVHLRYLCRGACGNVPLQAHLCGRASLPSHMQVYLASFLPVWK